MSDNNFCEHEEELIKTIMCLKPGTMIEALSDWKANSRLLKGETAVILEAISLQALYKKREIRFKCTILNIRGEKYIVILFHSGSDSNFKILKKSK